MTVKRELKNISN